MKKFVPAVAAACFCTSLALHAADSGVIADAVGNPDRAAENRARDGDRKPELVLAFIDPGAGDTVLDYGSGGGYWTELFSGMVGPDGRVYAHQNAGERFDDQRAGLEARFAPFGNVDLLPVARGEALPLDESSVDSVLLSYLFHHMHYSESSGDSLPDSSASLFGEFLRVLKPGGTLTVIEHAAAAGSSRAQSAGWHRTPPEMAKADISGTGFEFVADAPDIFHNPDDNLMNNWSESGLRGKTTTFVQTYRKPE